MITSNLKRNTCDNTINSGKESIDENEVLPSQKRRRKNLSSSDSEEVYETKVQSDTSCVIIWTSNSFDPKIHKFTSPQPGIKANVNMSSAIIDYFQLFFSEEFVHFIVSKTNSYYLESTNNNVDSPVQKETTLNELYCFFALSLLMTRNQKLSLYEYWSKDKLLQSEIFSEVMSKNRYFFILQMLHFSEEVSDNCDRFTKIRSVIDMLRKSFNESFQPFQKLCIDDSLILYKGQLSFTQYIPSKRNGFGAKTFVLCDCETGYIQDIIICTGTSTAMDAEYKNIGKSGEIVLSLLKPYLGKGHTVFVDNWCSSPTLFNVLHQNDTNVCGTVRKSQKEMPKIEERLKKGEVAFRSSENIVALKWVDKKEVYMLSTMHPPQLVEVPKCHVRGETTQKPVCVIDYNSSMSTLDKTDTVISTVVSTRKSLKWYRKYFFHLLDICVWNAYCLCKYKTKKNLSLAHFQLQLIREILEKYDSNPTRYNNKPCNSIPLRLTQRHFPSTYMSSGKNRNRRCVVCSKNDKRRETRYQCEDCDVGLCVSPCFKVYHTELYY